MAVLSYILAIPWVLGRWVIFSQLVENKRIFSGGGGGGAGFREFWNK